MSDGRRRRVGRRDASHLEERPRQRLSMLLAPSPDSLLTLDERRTLLHHAGDCSQLMRERLDVDGRVILNNVPQRTLAQAQPHIAAALALLCGRFLKKNGTLNPSAAAKACGKPAHNPAAVLDWVSKLKRLDAALIRGEMQPRGMTSSREQEAERACEKLARFCAESAVQSVVYKLRSERLMMAEATAAVAAAATAIKAAKSAIATSATTTAEEIRHQRYLQNVALGLYNDVRAPRKRRSQTPSRPRGRPIIPTSARQLRLAKQRQARKPYSGPMAQNRRSASPITMPHAGYPACRT